VKGHWLHVRRKIKENNWKIEQIRGLINKKAYEDQLTYFYQFYLGALYSTLSLSYSWTLEFSWSTLG